MSSFWEEGHITLKVCLTAVNSSLILGLQIRIALRISQSWYKSKAFFLYGKTLSELLLWFDIYAIFFQCFRKSPNYCFYTAMEKCVLHSSLYLKGILKTQRISDPTWLCKAVKFSMFSDTKGWKMLIRNFHRKWHWKLYLELNTLLMVAQMAQWFK